MVLRIFSTHALLSFFLTLSRSSPPFAEAATAAKESENTGVKGQEPPFRHRNLDYWDADTLAAYLSVSPTYPHKLMTSTDNAPMYAGNDAAILFYAQWCNNCHSLAPMWDQIAGIVEAGTTNSNVIMALFDCEQQESHKSLCSAAGITHYPTMLYVGKGAYHDTDPVTSTLMGKDRSAGPMGRSLLPHTVKFQGDWRYGDQILDWMSVMKGLSSYSKWKDSNGNNSLFGKVSKWILRPFSSSQATSSDKINNPNSNQMHVGIPPEIQMKQAYQSLNTPSSSDSFEKKPSSTESNTKITSLEKQISTLENEKQQYEQGYTHNSLLIDLLLFPTATDDGNDGMSKMEVGEDIFQTLSENWDEYPKIGEKLLDAKETEKTIPLLQSCAVEMTIDYCTRFLTKNTLDAYDMLSADKANLENREELLQEIQSRDEPFCNIVENCIANDFSTEECRPQTCPLQNPMGCRYVSSCFSSKMKEEYSKAYETLFQDLNGESDNGVSKSEKASSQGWGVTN